MSEPIQFIVIMATYNRCDRLVNAVQSIIDQTYSHWNLILVDDGSSDSTQQVFKSFDDPRIQCLTQSKNAGVNAARNRALAEVKARQLTGFITLLDDDDVFALNCFHEAAALILKNPGYSWYAANCVSTDGKKISRIKKYGEASYLYDYMYGKGIRGDQTHFIHTDALGDNLFSRRFKNAEEWVFFCTLAEKHRMYIFDFNAKIVNVLPDGLMSSGLNKQQQIDVLKYKIEILGPIVSSSLLARQRISLARAYLKAKHPQLARKELKQIPLLKCFSYQFLRAWLKTFFA